MTDSTEGVGKLTSYEKDLLIINAYTTAYQIWLVHLRLTWSQNEFIFRLHTR